MKVLSYSSWLLKMCTEWKVRVARKLFRGRLSAEARDTVLEATVQEYNGKRRRWRHLCTKLLEFRLRAVEVPADGDCGIHSLLLVLGEESSDENVEKYRELLHDSLMQVAGNKSWCDLYRALDI